MADAKFTEITYDSETGGTIYSDVDLSFKAHPVTGYSYNKERYRYKTVYA